MSETSPGEQPDQENFEEVANEMISKWQNSKLPEILHNAVILKTEEVRDASVEEVFADLDEYVKELKGNKKEEEGWKKDLLEKSDSNNFHGLFRKNALNGVLSGKSNSWGLKPFYVNSRYNNAWSQMCQEFPDDIKIIVGYEEGGYKKRPKTDDEKASLKKLALYLIDKGISSSFLCK